jgi:hypothetical protein
MKRSEHAICNSIITMLNYQGHHVWRQNAGQVEAVNKYGQKHRIMIGRAGVSDVIGMSKKGIFIAIEVKTPERRKYVTEAQANFLNDVICHHGIAGVATSEDEALAIVEDYVLQQNS